jgi:hypothetical protein
MAWAGTTLPFTLPFQLSLATKNVWLAIGLDKKFVSSSLM